MGTEDDEDQVDKKSTIAVVDAEVMGKVMQKKDRNWRQVVVKVEMAMERVTVRHHALREGVGVERVEVDVRVMVKVKERKDRERRLVLELANRRLEVGVEGESRIVALGNRKAQRQF